MAAALVFYTPLTANVTADVGVTLQGDAPAPTYSNVDDFTLNVIGLQVPSANLTSLFDVTDGVATSICAAIFTSVITASDEDRFFNSVENQVSFGGFDRPSLYSLASNIVPESLAIVTASNGIYPGTTPSVSTTGTSFAELFAQVNNNPTIVQNFYNDTQTIGGAQAASSITFLIELAVTKVVTYTISGVDYPAAPSGGYLYYDRVTGTPYPLTSLTDSSSGNVRFALKFNLAA